MMPSYQPLYCLCALYIFTLWYSQIWAHFLGIVGPYEQGVSLAATSIIWSETKNRNRPLSWSRLWPGAQWNFILLVKNSNELLVNATWRVTHGTYAGTKRPCYYLWNINMAVWLNHGNDSFRVGNFLTILGRNHSSYWKFHSNFLSSSIRQLEIRITTWTKLEISVYKTTDNWT